MARDSSPSSDPSDARAPGYPGPAAAPRAEDAHRAEGATRGPFGGPLDQLFSRLKGLQPPPYR
jgi:hypothetical protein